MQMRTIAATLLALLVLPASLTAQDTLSNRQAVQKLGYAIDRADNARPEIDAMLGHLADALPVIERMPATIDSLQALVDSLRHLPPDTVRLAAEGDSLRIWSLDAGGPASLAMGVDEYSDEIVALNYYAGRPHVCATVEGTQGWYELASVSPLVLAYPLRVVPQEEPECGVTWTVPDGAVAEIGDPAVVEVPVEGTETVAYVLVR